MGCAACVQEVYNKRMLAAGCPSAPSLKADYDKRGAPKRAAPKDFTTAVRAISQHLDQPIRLWYHPVVAMIAFGSCEGILYRKSFTCLKRRYLFKDRLRAL